MGIALDIDFSLIFMDFWSQVGIKMVSKIDKKTIQKSIKKRMEKKRLEWGVSGVVGVAKM